MASSQGNGEPMLLAAHGRHAQAVAFTKDGTLLATGSSDGMVRVGSFPHGRCVRTLEKQATAQFSPDGAQLATISVKGRIEVPVKGGYGLAISPDGRYLANAAADGKVRVWQRC